MNRKLKGVGNLPFKGDLKLIAALSVLIAVLMAVVAAVGFFYPDSIYPWDDLVQAFQATDLTTLLFGPPMLVVSLWLSNRGRLLGVLLWLGALIYVLYTYLIYLLAMPLNWAYLVHLALVMLSAYSLYALLTRIDGDAVQADLDGALPHRFGGGVLAVLGGGFFLRAVVMLVGGLGAGEVMPVTDLALNSTDFLISPLWVICGIALWRRKAFGAVTGLGVLFQASMLFIALIVVLLLEPVLNNNPLPWVDVIVVAVFGLVTFVPLGLYIRAVEGQS